MQAPGNRHLPKPRCRLRAAGTGVILWLIPGVTVAQLTPGSGGTQAQPPGRLLQGTLLERMTGAVGIFQRTSGLSATPIGLAVARIILMLISVLGLIFVGLITYAGYTWLTARGDEAKVTKARDTLRQAIWGLIIVLAAYSIAYFVIRFLLGEISRVPSPAETTGG